MLNSSVTSALFSLGPSSALPGPLIAGQHIVKLVPPDAVTLNPSRHSFCIVPHLQGVELPMFIKPGLPMKVELVRTDLSTGEYDTTIINIPHSGPVNDGGSGSRNAIDSRVPFNYSIFQAGAYSLGRAQFEPGGEELVFTDSYGPTIVVDCPWASFRGFASTWSCIPDSHADLTVEIKGTPPLEVTLCRTNTDDPESQPACETLPKMGEGQPSLLDAKLPDPHGVQFQQSFTKPIPSPGIWRYSLMAVQDGLGNIVKYQGGAPRSTHTVLARQSPRAWMEGCTADKPLLVPKGESASLPVWLDIWGSGEKPGHQDTGYSVAWLFTPKDKTAAFVNGSTGLAGCRHDGNGIGDRPQVSVPGLYTLTKVRVGTCQGTVESPSATCRLVNPAEPQLLMGSSNLTESCDGLEIDFKLTGTPPFTLYYEDSHGTHLQTFQQEAPFRLPQPEAGLQRYVFTHISDSVYERRKLMGAEYILERHVEPRVNAFFPDDTAIVDACHGEEVRVNVTFVGKPPFALDYVITKNGITTRHEAQTVGSQEHTIISMRHTKTGLYEIALQKVHDGRGCSRMVDNMRKMISADRPMPYAAFNYSGTGGKILTIKGSAAQLPLVLGGKGPWKISLEHRDSLGVSSVAERTVENPFLTVDRRGSYTITEVWDSRCRGDFDPQASVFEIQWHPQPSLVLVAGSRKPNQDDLVNVLNDVCEGDDGGFHVRLQGTPPFQLRYTVLNKAVLAETTTARKSRELSLNDRTAWIPGDASRPGMHIYEFLSLADKFHDASQAIAGPVVTQIVNRRPFAFVGGPHRTLTFCDACQHEEIPIVLAGRAPFDVEFELLHEASEEPIKFGISGISNSSYNLKVPRHHLLRGSQSIHVRKVRDANGCVFLPGPSEGSVTLRMHESPMVRHEGDLVNYCRGDQVSFSLSGAPPFTIWLRFNGHEHKVEGYQETTFRWRANFTGNLTISAISDQNSGCPIPVALKEILIHPIPSVRLVEGTAVIFEGDKARLHFLLSGTPPFQVTYRRLEGMTRTATMVIGATEKTATAEVHAGGVYEPVAVEDFFCRVEGEETPPTVALTTPVF